MADRYATVPAFTEDLPVADEPDSDRPERAQTTAVDEERGNAARPSEEALGKGRVAPTQQRPVSQSSSSGRQQPTRQTRSKRGKK